MTPANDKVFQAASAGDILALRSALVAGGDLAARREGTRDTVLHVAVAFGRESTTAFLLEAGADPNAQNIDGRTPLHEAAFLRTPACWNRLIEAGAKDDIRDRAGVSPQGMRDTLAQANAMVDYSVRQASLETDRSHGR